MVTSNAMARKMTRLEDARCFRGDLDIRLQYHREIQCEQEFEELRRLVQIDDRELIERLLSFGFDANTIAALSLLPLAEIAWASGDVSTQEEMVAKCCVIESELIGNPSAVAVFQSWLHRRSSPQLMQLWREYTEHCTKAMRPSLRLAVGRRLKHQATQIAEASGGYLGIGRICDAEQSVLDLIDRTFGLGSCVGDGLAS